MRQILTDIQLKDIAFGENLKKEGVKLHIVQYVDLILILGKCFS